jgi:D-serine deaminase-like pyridoxal phosphate-dependent protein
VRTCRPRYTLEPVNLSSLRTPCVLVDQLRLERNIERMQSGADARGIRLRPHAKTHKSPDLAKIQIARGAVGICCAKLGEAEVFAAAGVQDIRLPYPLHPSNSDRVLALLDRTRLSFIVDHLDVARGWSRAMQAAGRTVDVLVKVDVGFHRCGINPHAADAVDFVVEVSKLPALRLRGLLSHAGHAYGASSEGETSAIAQEEAQILRTLRDRAVERGVGIEEISVGATPTARYSLHQEGVTEMRPGNYVYFDRTQVGLGSATWEDCALTVLAQVVSRPAADRIIFDSGSKTLTNDPIRAGKLSGFGTVLQSLDSSTPDESLTIERLSEEHATVRVDESCSLVPGDLVRIIPNHSCVVSNLVDSVWLVSGDQTVDRIEVAARGRIQ